MGNKRTKQLAKEMTRKRKKLTINYGMFCSKKRRHDHDVDLTINATAHQSTESRVTEIPSISILPELHPLQPDVAAGTSVNQLEFSHVVGTPSKIELQPSELADVTDVCSFNPTEHDYIVEAAVDEDENFETCQGRRIVDVSYFLSKLKYISNHSALFNCGCQSLSLVGEKRLGLLSKFKMKCDMCASIFYIDSEDPAHLENVDANVGAVMGIVSSGIAYAQFEEIISCINVPIFSKRYFLKIQDKLYDQWETTAADEMKAAAEREKLAALAEGNHKNGIAVIDVYADGCWSSRSYGNNYKALSGAAVIIGRRFGEVLYMAVRNKYCLICALAQKKGVTPKEHTCYKNYNGSSSGMEAEIISEGFRSSIEMYNIIYGRLIADGDSATYAKILAADPYTCPKVTVKKIECRNHILRNVCNKLRALAKETKYPLIQRKLLCDHKIMTIRKFIVSSIKTNKKMLADALLNTAQAIKNVHFDVQNSILHAFGDHRSCKDYCCNKEKVLTSALEISNSIMWFRLKVIIGNVAAKSGSLIEDVDTNVAERFNSVVAKMVGGKRICFATRRSYQGRCAAAVVSFNNNLPKFSMQKRYLGRSPRNNLRKFEQRRIKKREWNKIHPSKKNRSQYKYTRITQHNYGVNSEGPDMTKQELEIAKEEFLKNLLILTSDKQRIERDTLLQRDCDDWLELRKNMVTASNFGKIIKRRKGTSCSNLVKNILYKKNLTNVSSIAHGIENEKLAIEQLAMQENITIEPCGLFIDSNYSFIGATPDGVVGNEIIVEIKCPITAYKKGIDQAITENKIQIYKLNKKTNTLSINQNSDWYFQVQGQLHVTGKRKCIFAIWSGENQRIKVEYIERDDNFWKEKMEQKLVTFYMECLLPEIVNPRHSRGMPIRDSNVPQV